MTSRLAGQIPWLLLLSASVSPWSGVPGEEQKPPAAETGRPAHEFTFVRLKYSSFWQGKLAPDDEWGWNYHPLLFPTLIEPFRKRTLIDVADKELVLAPGSKDIFSYPLLYMEGMRPFVFSDEEALNLRRYVYRGGLLFIDDSGPWPHRKDQFEGSILAEARRVLPTEPLRNLPPDHPIFQCFYALDGVPLLPHIGMTHPHSPLEAIEVKGRIGILISYNDFGGAARHIKEPRERGAYTKGAQELAWRFFINLVIYAMSH
jgi:hypothetical protein